MKKFIRLVLLSVLILLSLCVIQAQQKEKKDEVQRKIPELVQPAYMKYHPGKNRLYLCDGGVSGGWYHSSNQKTEKHDQINSENTWGSVYEIHPEDVGNRYRLPNLELNSCNSVAFVGDSMYCGGLYKIVGYNLNTSSTFSSVSSDTFAFLDSWFDNANHIYFLGVDKSDYSEIQHKSCLISYDVSSNTFTRVQIQDTNIYNATAMIFDEEDNKLIFVIKRDSSAIAEYSLTSNSFSIIRETTINNLEDITMGDEGHYFLSNWNKNVHKEGHRIFRIDKDFQGNFETIDKNGIEYTFIYYLESENTIYVDMLKNIYTIYKPFNKLDLYSPPDGSTNKETCILFKYELDKNANTYRIQISKNPNFSTLVKDSTKEIFNVYLREYNTFPIFDGFEFNTTYYWRVQPKYYSEEGLWSNSSSFTTGSSNIPGPTIVSPHPDSIKQNNYIKLIWNSVPGTNEYLVGVRYQLKDGGVSDIDQYKITNDTSTVISELFNAFYSISVKVSDGDSAGIWSEPRNIGIYYYPIESPLIKYPRGNSGGIENSVEIFWYSESEATHYEVKIRRNWTDDWRYFQVNSNSIIIDSLILRTNYQYAVRGLNDTAVGNWSYENFCTADSLVNPPGLINVSGNKEFKFEWENSNADWYEMQIIDPGNDESFTLESGKSIPYYLTTPLIYKKNIKDTKYIVKEGLKSDKKYFWRVRAVKNTNNSVWSEAKAFDVTIPVEEQPNSTESINIYPNPANSSVTIDINIMFNESITIELFNTLGQKLNNMNLNSVAGQSNYRHIINIEELPSGLYYIVVSSGDMKEVRSLVKM
jgi:hypothetical protein